MPRQVLCQGLHQATRLCGRSFDDVRAGAENGGRRTADRTGRVPVNAIKTIYGSRRSGANGDGGRKMFRPYGEGGRMRIPLLASMLWHLDDVHGRALTGGVEDGQDYVGGVAG
jgi:hypothetical protein